MVLVDTSVWVDHLRRGNPVLIDLLENMAVAIHPFVIGELACGNLSNRAVILGLLGELPQAPTAGHGEAMLMIERRMLMGRGLGFIDIHLLAATALHGTLQIWTRDKRLNACATELGIAYLPMH